MRKRRLASTEATATTRNVSQRRPRSVARTANLGASRCRGSGVVVAVMTRVCRDLLSGWWAYDARPGEGGTIADASAEPEDEHGSLPGGGGRGRARRGSVQRHRGA